MKFYAALLSATLPIVSAVFADEAYQVDFHYAFVGEPQSSSTFFHQPVKGSKASLLYTVSDRSILGAINPKDGAILWRQVLSTNQTKTPSFASAADDHDSIVSASDSRVSSWSAADGRLIWERDFGLEVVQSLAIEQAVQKDALVVVQGSSSFKVHKLDSLTGSTKWTYEDTSGDTPHQILHSGSTTYLVSLHSTMLKGMKIKVASLDHNSGKSTDQHTLGSDGDISVSQDIVLVGSAGNYPIVVWADSSKRNLKVNMLGTKDIKSFEIGSSAVPIESIVAHSSSQSNGTPHFLVHYQTRETHWADVFEIDGKKTLRKIHSLPSVFGKGAFSVNAMDGRTYFVRITQDTLVLYPSTTVAALTTWPVDFTLPGMADNPSPVHATAEVVVRPGSSSAVRAAILLSSGDWALIRNGEISWSRPEALAGISKANWAEDSNEGSLAQELDNESSSNVIASFIHRSLRHINDLKSLAFWLQNLPNTDFSQQPTTLERSSSVSTKTDAFGFSKLLIVATENGRLIALDIGDKGRLVWNKPNLEDSDLHPSNAIPKEVGDYTRYSLQNGILYGRKNQESNNLWSFKPRPGYRIKSVTPQLNFEPIASIGKVLGDRRVLYKYLNPNAALVMAVNDEISEAVATLLDTVSGNVLYSSKHVDVDTSRPISTAISENWMTFSYTIDSPLDSVAKGYQLVMAEFYESNVPDDRGLFDVASNYSAVHGSSPASKPHVISQSFHVPEEISKMAISQTGQGITSRQLIVGLSGSNSIVGIPSQAIDPRRIVGKDPSSSQLEEGLSRYTPMIDFDPRWYLNHKEEIVGVKEILTTPTMLESTSFVVAFGLDVFGTRVSPSFAFDILGKSFNKIQLVLTVIALQAGVFIVAPLIQRKQTNALWQAL